MRVFCVFTECSEKKIAEIVIQSINLKAEDKNKINHLATLRVFRNNNTFFFLNSAHWFPYQPTHAHGPDVWKRCEGYGQSVESECGSDGEKKKGPN